MIDRRYVRPNHGIYIHTRGGGSPLRVLSGAVILTHIADFNFNFFFLFFSSILFGDAVLEIQIMRCRKDPAFVPGINYSQ